MSSKSSSRYLWLSAAAVALAAGLWAGLARLGWVIPPLAPHHPSAHGPLMLGGFAGVIIGFERAATLGRGWAYLAPASAALSTAWVLLRPEWRPAAGLLTVASLVTCVISVALLRRHDDWATRVVSLGAITWFLGNLHWAFTGMVLIAVPWWAAFLIFTLLGKRLELKSVSESSLLGILEFNIGVTVLMGGLLAAYIHHGFGLRGFGLGLVALAVWGLRWDVAWRMAGLSPCERFVAWTRGGGYVWLAVSGVVMLVWGEQLGGLPWDAALHALFLGFVFSMIFAHLPRSGVRRSGVRRSGVRRSGVRSSTSVIFRHGVNYTSAFYGHVMLLHASLLLRVGSDLLGSTEGRAFGSLLNMVAIVAFLLNTLRAAIMGLPTAQR